MNTDYQISYSSDKIDEIASLFSEYATNALLDEVHTTPKPGLVDCRNSGSHTDMDLEMFEISAHTLKPFFYKMAKAGMNSDNCMPLLQKIGLEAENAMFRATGGINTHKGAIFAIGLLIAATSASFLRGGDPFERVSNLALESAIPPKETHGSTVLRNYKKDGARAAAIDGLPAAQYAYKLLAESNMDPVSVLLCLITKLDDTNLLYRGGCEGLSFAKGAASYILSQPIEYRQHLTESLDNEFIKRNLSPGGCADMLAAGFFLQYTKDYWKKTCQNMY